MSPPPLEPRVSVVIPAFDASSYVAEALRSVLDQTRPPDEVIVVDDGSTDDTATIAASFGTAVRVLQQPHTGPGAARNSGVAASTGDIVAFCDADDIWLPDKLTAQLDLIDDPARPLAVFCGASEFLSPELDPTTSRRRPPIDEIPIARLPSALLATRAALDQVGPFLDEDSTGEWVPWCIRLVDAVEVRSAPGLLIQRRLHDHNTSGTDGARSARWAAALHAHVRAQRTDPSGADPTNRS